MGDVQCGNLYRVYRWRERKPIYYTMRLHTTRQMGLSHIARYLGASQQMIICIFVSLEL